MKKRGGGDQNLTETREEAVMNTYHMKAKEGNDIRLGGHLQI